jgi:hypothetical protein
MSQPPMPPGPPTEPLPQPQSQTWPLLGTRTPISRAAAPDGVQPQQGPVPVQQQPKKRFGWPTVIVTAVVALSLGGIVGGIVGGSGNGTATTAEPNATVTVSQTVTKTAEAKPASKAPSPKKTTEPEPKSTISNGIHEVGVDVKAGQYKTNVPEGELCYWERSRGADDISDSTSTSTYKEGPARQSVTLKKGESFETEDCGTWKRV